MAEATEAKATAEATEAKTEAEASVTQEYTFRDLWARGSEKLGAGCVLMVLGFFKMFGWLKPIVNFNNIGNFFAGASSTWKKYR